MDNEIVITIIERYISALSVVRNSIKKRPKSYHVNLNLLKTILNAVDIDYLVKELDKK